jgi:hypothetical protein
MCKGGGGKMVMYSCVGRYTRYMDAAVWDLYNGASLLLRSCADQRDCCHDMRCGAITVRCKVVGDAYISACHTCPNSTTNSETDVGECRSAVGK